MPRAVEREFFQKDVQSSRVGAWAQHCCRPASNDCVERVVRRGGEIGKFLAE